MHVFVSYKHEDSDFAENVMNHLEKAGFQTWADHKIGAGKEWRNEIDLAIKNSFALIVIMTPEAKTSEYVTYEWAFAWGIGISVIPMMLKNTELHPRLEALQYLDFTSRTVRPWNKLLEEVQAASKIPLDHTISTPLNAPPFIRQAVTALDSASPTERNAAIQTLAHSRGPEVKRVLLEALQHPIEDVRLSTALALWEQGDTSGKSIFIETLQHGTNEQRRQILSTLGNAKTTIDLGELMNILLENLRDPEPLIRQAAFAILDNIAYPIETFEVLQLLQDSNDEIRSRAAKMLGNIGDACAIPALSEALLQTPYSEIHQTIAEALGKIGDPTAIPALSKVFQNIQSSPGGLNGHARRICESIIIGLGEIGDPNVIPLLLKWGLLLQPSVIDALKMIKGPSVIYSLLDFLKDTDFATRLSTVQILGAIRMNNPIVQSALVEALEDDPDPTVRQSIADTVEKIADASVVPDLAKAFQRNNQPHEAQIRLSIINALGKFGGTNIVPTLIEALRDSDPSVCGQAATLLKEMDDASIVPSLGQLLSRDEYKNSRFFIIQILGSIGNMSVEPILYRISLDDSDLQARFQAKGALQKIRKRAVPTSET